MVFGSLSERYRLNDANLLNACSQLLQSLLVKVSAWLVRISFDLIEWNLAYGRRALRAHASSVDKRVEPLASFYGVESTSEHASVVFLVYCHLFVVLIDYFLGQSQVVLRASRVCVVQYNW